jgi:hypothetical protein
MTSTKIKQSASELKDSLLGIVQRLSELGEIEWHDNGMDGKEIVIKLTALEADDESDNEVPVVSLMVNDGGIDTETGDDGMAEMIQSDAAKSLHDFVRNKYGW